ncbi:Tetratricopeptide repeat protein 36, partial [Calypte anna]
MATANDRAVLQTIFNPSTPFGDIPRLDEEEDAQEEVEIFGTEVLEQVRDLELQGISAAESGDVSRALERALQDLDTAIRLSQGRGCAARQSLVQRGLIHRLQGHEEEARWDFERAARLGSAFARRQLVLLNPYAALCNQMLCEMLGRLCNP